MTATEPPYKKGQRVTGRPRIELRDRVKAMYVEEQKSIRRIAKATGRSYHVVWNLLKEADVELRSRGGARTQTRRTVETPAGQMEVDPS